jgi:imidazole glycerol phosphate synthase, glutamine amidotransferase subunit
LIAIIDYGAGNLQSVVKAFDSIGCETKITANSEEILAADAAVLPGVGAFGDAIQNLSKLGLDKTVKAFVATQKPFLGICLGMQVLFESSEESPRAKGLHILKGEIHRIPKIDDLKVPHMGWNSLIETENKGLFQGIESNPYVYFVHSYYLKAEEDIVSSVAEYGVQIHASIQKGNIFATQFHPEKSGETGLNMLRNFKALCEKEA